MTSSNETIPRPGRMAYVTTTISGDRVAPEYWTRYSGIEPDFYVEKGRQFVTPVGKLSAGIGKSNIWGYSSRGIIRDDTLGPHLGYLISKLKLPRPDLKVRLEADMLNFRFSCFWVKFTHDRIPIIEPHLEKVIN